MDLDDVEGRLEMLGSDDIVVVACTISILITLPSRRIIESVRERERRQVK